MGGSGLGNIKRQVGSNQSGKAGGIREGRCHLPFCVRQIGWDTRVSLTEGDGMIEKVRDEP